MEYLFLIMDNDQALDRLSEEQRQGIYQTHMALSAKMDAAGVKKDGRPLQPPSTATTVRSTDGTDRVISDGPYAETKEHLGGYYLVDVADLDEALDWAKQIPLPPGLAVEIRPALPMGDS
jgi:hypothetical protein